MSMASGHPPQTRSFRSCGSIRSRSASELLLRKRPSFLASRRFAPGYPGAMLALGLGYFLRKYEYFNFKNLFKDFCLEHLIFGFV